MALVKFAEFDVLDVVAAVPKNAGQQRLARARREAHRHHFSYSPRRGFIYVRSRAISSRTNDNYDEFPAEEIKQAYRTFIGKPVFVNHHNSDHRRARGVIIDAALHEDINPDGSPDTWAEVLMEVDAVRFPVLAREVLAGNIARTSMGTDVAYSVCTACGNRAETPADYCQHIPALKGMKIRRVNAATGANEEVLIAERCYGLGFFENSLLVEDPADPTAVSWMDHDASGLSIAAAKQVIEEAEHIVREAAEEPVHKAVSAMIGYDHLCGAESGKHDWEWEGVTCPACLKKKTAHLQTQASSKGTAGPAVTALLRAQAYGETKAPSQVDTMRAEACPVCGDDESFNGDKCNVCGYTQPPSQFRDPDLSKAREMDLRQDQAEGQGADLSAGVGVDGPVDVLPEDQAQDEQGEDLQCTNCGEVFSAEGDAATSPGDDPDQVTPPEEEADPEPAATPTDPDRDKARDPKHPDDLSDLEDKTDEELGLTDKDDEDEDEEEVQRKVDKTTEPSGEGRVTPGDEPAQQDPKDPLGDLTIAPNMTCPVCGEGTLIPMQPQPVKDEPDAVEVGTEDPKKKERLGSQDFRHRAGAVSRRTRSTDMNQQNPGRQPNSAQQGRNRIIAAVREQQGVIEEQQRTIAGQGQAISMLIDSVATLAVAANVGNHPRFAGLVRAAGLHTADSAQNPDGAPATSTEESRKPQSTDDVNSVGAAPGEVNKDVTPKGVTDVQNSNVTVNPPVLDNLQDPSKPVQGTDSVDPGASFNGDVKAQAPSNDSFDKPSDSGWTGSPGTVQRSSAMGTDVERFTASLRLARLQIRAGLEEGEDIALATRIASSGDPLDVLHAQAQTLQAVAQAQSAHHPTQDQQRRLVPRAAARQGIVPANHQAASPLAMQTIATTTEEGREGEDQWVVGSVDD